MHNKLPLPLLTFLLLSSFALAIRNTSQGVGFGGTCQQECQINRINAQEPSSRVESEGGITEFWDYNNNEFQCAGASLHRHILQPQSMMLPAYHNAPVLVYILQGRGMFGLLLSGCPETFESSQQSQQGDRRQMFLDRHQKISHYQKGDIIAIPAGAAHWAYNDADEESVFIGLVDITNNVNQLGQTPKTFYLAGTSQQQQQPGQQGISGGQHEFGNVFRGFDIETLVEVFGVDQETARKLRGENDQRGPLIKIPRGLQVISPPIRGTGERPGSGEFQPGWEGEYQPGSPGYQPGWERPGSYQPGGKGHQPSWEKPGSYQPGQQPGEGYQPSYQPGGKGHQPSWERPGSYQPGQQPGEGYQPSYQPGGKGGGKGHQPSWGRPDIYQPGSEGHQPSYQPGGKGHQPSWGKPGSYQPGQQPGEGYQPSYQPGGKGHQPSSGKPGSYQPGSEGYQPSYQPGGKGYQPSWGRPGSYQPGQGYPGFGKPGSYQPGQQPGSGYQPSYQPGGKGHQPSWERPGSYQPGFGKPGSYQPGFGKPGSYQPGQGSQGSCPMGCMPVSESGCGAAANGLEETICTAKHRENINNPARADIYNPRAGQLSTINSLTLPILSFLQLSASRGVLHKNAIMSPHWCVNANRVMYIIRGDCRMQIVDHTGQAVFDGQVTEGQAIVVPQNFAVVKQAGEQGAEWIVFNTNDNAMLNTLSGRTSALRGLPAAVIANAYQIPNEQAQRLKYSRQETLFFSPSRSGRQGRVQIPPWSKSEGRIATA